MSEYESISGLQKTFLENGEIHVAGFINDETADYVHECMLHLQAHGSPDIKVIIRSHGGQIDAGLHIYDEFRHYAGETKAIVRGFAHSAAAVLLQGCTERLAYRHSTVLLHDGSFAMKLRIEDMNAKTVSVLKKSMIKSRDRVHKLLVQHTNLDLKKVRVLMDLDKKIYAEEALKFGIIDGLC